MEEEDDIIFEYEKALVDVSGEDDIGKGVARALDPNDSSSNCCMLCGVMTRYKKETDQFMARNTEAKGRS